MDVVGLVMAPDEMTAEMWCELLQNNGIPATPKLAGAGTPVALGTGAGMLKPCWVMVREEDIERAAAILDPIAHVKHPQA